jgi:hypothetical protein
LLDLMIPYSNQMVCTGLSWAGSFDHYIGILEAVMGRLDEADARLAEAEAAHARVPAPSWLARSRLERARVLLSRRAAGDLERAGDLLNEVVGTAREYDLGGVERAAAGLLRKMSSWV